MLKKLLIIYAFLFSYSGAILHSIVPHHHHNSFKEAKEHHHHDHHTSHSHSDEQDDSQDHEHKGSLYFLTHSANNDIVVTHSSIDGATKIKKAEKWVASFTSLPVFELITSRQVFHPPSDDLTTHSTAYLFRALRAPPTAII